MSIIRDWSELYKDKQHGITNSDVLKFGEYRRVESKSWDGSEPRCFNIKATFHKVYKRYPATSLIQKVRILHVIKDSRATGSANDFFCLINN